METTSRNSSTDSQNHDTNVNVAIPFAPNFATSASQQKGSQQTSPFAITSMLHDLSIATPGVTLGPTSDISTNKNSGSLVDSLLADIGHGPYLLKIGQIPEDLTERESHLIFSLADGIESVRLVDDKDGKEVEKEHKSNVSEPGKRIEATMKNLRLLAQYATILSRKDTLFGPQQSKKCTIEAIDQESNKNIDLELLKQVFEAHKSMHPEHKNESIGQRHSRFSFNDPFSSEGVNSSLVFQTNQSNQSSNPATQLSGISENPVPIESTIHQSNRANSFLVRENNDINESIWNDNGINNSLNGLVASSQPQTPSVDWTGQNDRKKSAAFYFPNNPSQANVMPAPTGAKQTQVGLASQLPSGELGQQMQINTNMGMPNASQPFASSTSLSSFNVVPQLHGDGQSFVNPITASDLNIGVHDGSRFTPFNPVGQTPTLSMQNNQVTTENAQLPLMQGNTAHKMGPSRITPQRNALSSNMIPKVGNVNSSNMGMTSEAQFNKQSGLNSTASSTSNIANIPGSNNISQADLSLLARIPPPANPADQNPPCNTLYVGNLPSDATEQELRQLFSNQFGFRRLSFRNKNANGTGHGHGPMCFVEFDDVSCATRALVELYGSQLPRATVNTKGGIRLSFSKNPLGVRGPTNKRNTNTSSTNVSSNNLGSTQGQNSGIVYNKP